MKQSNKLNFCDKTKKFFWFNFIDVKLDFKIPKFEETHKRDIYDFVSDDHFSIENSSTKNCIDTNRLSLITQKPFMTDV